MVIAAVTCISTVHAEDAAKIPGIDREPAAAESLKKYGTDAGMKIRKVAVEMHSKVTVYESELVARGKAKREVAVIADGKVKGEDETVALDEVPDVVRKAIEVNAKGKTVYEAEIKDGKGKVVVTFTEVVKVLERENPDAKKAKKKEAGFFPRAPLRRLVQRSPGGQP